MKKIMILMLSLAVLFSFAACDNSTPADTEDTPSGTPVTVDATRYAAETVNGLLFTGSEAKIDIPSIIEDATSVNTEVSGQKVVITKKYPQGSALVGTVTLTLDGTYTAAKDDKDATLAVTKYTVAAEDLQIPAASSSVGGVGEVQNVTFSIDGIVAGNLVYTFAKDGSIKSTTGDVEITEVYTTLPIQSASITMGIPVAKNSNGYVYETQTISGENFVEALATVGNTHSAIAFMKTTFDAYWAQINGNDGNIVSVIKTGITATSQDTAKTYAEVTYAPGATAQEDGKYVQKGNVEVVFHGVDFAFGSAKLNGTFTMNFATTRTGATEAAIVNSTDLVITGYTISAEDVKLAGVSYPVTISGDITGVATDAHEITAKFTAEAGKNELASFETGDFGAVGSATVDVNGVEINL